MNKKIISIFLGFLLILSIAYCDEIQSFLPLNLNIYSVPRVDTWQGHGSGVVIGIRNIDNKIIGYVLTASHVSDIAHLRPIIFKKNKSYENHIFIKNVLFFHFSQYVTYKLDCKMTGYDQWADLAILEVVLNNARDIKPIKLLKECDDIMPGEDAYLIGWPGNSDVTVTVGKISNNIYTLDGFGKKYILSNTEIKPGNSGGALIVVRDIPRLAGVPVMINKDGAALSIDIKTVREFLREQDYSFLINE